MRRRDDEEKRRREDEKKGKRDSTSIAWTRGMNREPTD